MANGITTGWKRGKILGVGGSSHVYEARTVPETIHSRLFPPLMAVKSTVDYAAHSHELNVLSKLMNHPHVIGLYFTEQSLEDNTRFYNIFMEYASGGNLIDQVTANGGGLSEFEVSGYVKEVLLGLDFLHELGYVHCDIKPENILIVNGVAKIADFGLTIQETVLPNVKGTTEFVAPEVVRERKYTCKADIWALGLTVLGTISGSCLWGPNFESSALLKLIGFSDVVPIFPRGLSKEAVDFLSKCLVKNYKLRWTARMLLDHPFVRQSYGEVTSFNTSLMTRRRSPNESLPKRRKSC